MKLIIVFAFTVIYFTPVLACYNESHVNNSGKQTNRVEPMALFYNEPDKTEATAFLAKYALDKLNSYDKDIQSDIAVNLGYLGRYTEALDILKKLQLKYPSDYNIAANLGTTYELLGKNELALQFINKGLQLNPDSHEGSEWVHVKILEAKLKMATVPDWIYKNRVLMTGVKFDSKEAEILNDQAWDVEYQLQERVPFTPFPDALLANVFDELGDLYATQQSVELAYIAYDFALRNDSADHFSVRSKMQALKPILKKNKIPVPSWKEHYFNRQQQKIQSEITEDEKEPGITPDKPENKKVRNREQEAKNRENNLILAGSIILAGFVAIFIYTNRKKQKTR